MTLLLQWAF
jgi:hypothetical protein